MCVCVCVCVCELFPCPYSSKVQVRPPRDREPATRSRVSGQERIFFFTCFKYNNMSAKLINAQRFIIREGLILVFRLSFVL